MNNDKIDKSKLKGLELAKERRDIRIVFFIFSVLFAIFAWRHYASIVSYVLMAVVLLILPLIAFSPLTLRPAFKLWLKVAYIIGKFNTQILLSVIFVLLFIPTGLIMRLFGKDPMKRKMLIEGTYWEQYDLEGLKDKSRYEKQF